MPTWCVKRPVVGAFASTGLAVVPENSLTREPASWPVIGTIPSFSTWATSNCVQRVVRLCPLRSASLLNSACRRNASTYPRRRFRRRRRCHRWWRRRRTCRLGRPGCRSRCSVRQTRRLRSLPYSRISRQTAQPSRLQPGQVTVGRYDLYGRHSYALAIGTIVRLEPGWAW
jgi:hypothetical protein